jgi:DNA polymerase III delta prime subunit
MNTEAENSIIRKLDYFHRNQKIPHIIFYGPATKAKDILISQFINKIYSENRLSIKQNVLFVSCSGKGIKFIRDEIKTFSKMHSQDPENFKTVILINADFLTDDAQSALRRSIELFSYNTRFFMIVENKSKLLKPILSRFCEIYSPSPEKNMEGAKNEERITTMMSDMQKMGAEPSQKEIIDLVSSWYERGYSSYDLMFLIDERQDKERDRVLNVQFMFYKLRKEYRCEKLFMWTLLDHYLYGSFDDLKNV